MVEMPILRLAYTTLFLIALLAVFEVWGQVGGQNHLDLMPWYLKLGLGVGVAYACVKVAAAAASSKYAWNSVTLRWCGILLILLLACGVASYYVHVYGEDDEDDDEDATTPAVAVLSLPQGSLWGRPPGLPTRRRRATRAGQAARPTPQETT
jgi:hypothetical protein